MNETIKGQAVRDPLTIGRLAKIAGVNVETIRYYQRRGIVEEPAKPVGGHRRYAHSHAKRVRFVKRAQLLGFTLEEVADLLRLEDGKSCRETRVLAQRKLMLIEHRLADLNRIRRTLKTLIAQCATGRRPKPCPIIASLSSDPT